ncbi:Hexokinase [Penicillium cinerascens]|uniref:Phosphotransferase n=1 Tax=Penicillium cinerascens TaxID=70096 RepID=A0A9W9MM89_9EURO|nr:Hexokinase [Penicillium cinerascens]KAJ5203878.1 Hexokinase [Penicillium cinerascens]
MLGFRTSAEILTGAADHMTRDLKQYEDWFTLEPPMLKQITNHFVKELDKSLTNEGGNITSPDRPDLDARLYACGIAAICKKKETSKCHVGVDGSVFNKYSGFKQRAAQALREIFDWPPNEPDLIVLIPSEDGSSVGGAALAAALALDGGIEGDSDKEKED